ncbi:MAG: hypothetical protein RR413_08605 [Christensenellaceae bacterium]
MFSNVGEKLKKLAKVLMWGGIIFSVIYGVFIMAGMPVAEGMENVGKGASIISGILTMILGAFMSWVSSWAVYAVGQISTDVKKLADKNR